MRKYQFQNTKMTHSTESEAIEVQVVFITLYYSEYVVIEVVIFEFTLKKLEVGFLDVKHTSGQTRCVCTVTIYVLHRKSSVCIHLF